MIFMERFFIMDNSKTVGFAKKLSIGLLDLRTMKFKRIANVDKDHYIFDHIVPPFDYFFYNEILIISDPIVKRSRNKSLNMFGFEIKQRGDFIAFFHLKKFDYVNYAMSLTLPEFESIRKEIKISKNEVKISKKENKIFKIED